MQEFTDNTQSRKWLLTINNPQLCGLDHTEIIDRLQKFNPDYFCMADEIGATGTYHTHIYLFSSSPMRFGTVKRRFPPAHIDKADGTSQQNRDYIRKEGKWADTAKAETCVDGTFFEYGTMPPPEAENAPKMYQLLQDVADGMDVSEIIRNNPNFGFKMKEIGALRSMFLAEPFRVENREVQVHYLYGETGTGKTWGILQKHSPKDVCRITSYGGKNGVRFDAYDMQPVLVFEEFHSQIPIADMLSYLDKYPATLPARYHDKTACYTTVYITSNAPLEQQYTDIQRDKPETWKAFLRRIKTITEFRKGQPPREVKHDTE